MKKQLRLLAWILSLTMLCELLPFSAFAQSDVGEALASTVSTLLDETNDIVDSGTCGDNVTWSLSSDGTLTLSGTGETYNYSWWANNLAFGDIADDIQNIIIDDGITTIGSSLFFHLDNLTDVSIPDSVTSIGVDAFNFCVSLPTITIPDSVTHISAGVFANCSSLENFIFPNGTTSINGWIFHNSTGLTSVFIPDSVTNIESYAFEGCTSLQNIYYAGTQEQWENVNISSSNSSLQDATIHYNSNESEDTDKTHHVTVINGTIDLSLTSEADVPEGEDVGIVADNLTTSEHKRFTGWNVTSGNIVLDNNENYRTTFTMKYQKINLINSLLVCLKAKGNPFKKELMKNGMVLAMD